MGVVQKKILLLLAGGFALSCSRSQNQQWKIIKEITEEWHDLTSQQIERAVASLYESRLVKAERKSDGSFALTINENGKKKTLSYHLETVKIKRPKEWDKRWHIISFDIPEDIRSARDSLRHHLIRLGFFEMHQSTFVHAFPCRDEIEYIIELYDLRKYVRIITATDIDVEARLKKFFNISTV